MQLTRTALITGGAGFIGTNLAGRLLQDPGLRVRIFDNCSRAGVEHNLRWLRSLPNAARLEFVRGDIRDLSAVRRAVDGATEIYHLAAQVAVTTSVADPIADFQVNASGTLNILEAARLSTYRPFLLFTSTNKVYGSLHNLPVVVDGIRYCAADRTFQGVTEDQSLDFHSPYGCSKGAADQYVRDFARIYDLPTVVFRMSCIAGPRQFGNEDQGWVAHFLYSVLLGRPLTIYGSGFQVRDVLHVDDLVDAMIAARAQSKYTAGEVFNLGGGMSRTASLLEMLSQIETLSKPELGVLYREVRPGDQPLYISETSKLEKLTGWKAHRPLSAILESIHHFWTDHRREIAEVHANSSNLVQAEVA